MLPVRTIGSCEEHVRSRDCHYYYLILSNNIYITSYTALSDVYLSMYVANSNTSYVVTLAQTSDHVIITCKQYKLLISKVGYVTRETYNIYFMSH